MLSPHGTLRLCFPLLLVQWGLGPLPQVPSSEGEAEASGSGGTEDDLEGEEGVSD